ncbi:MAG: hypothetical protein MUF01_06175 [Bryobacterales bacterium]|jgi:hypothetical protein|nr:hypothetical protein [Bryobacterales bacterium]
MKTRLRILNVLLLAVCAFTGWQMRASHLEHQSRMEKTFSVKVEPAAAAEVTIDPLPQPPSAGEFSVVAMRMLFAQDRNPTVVEEKKPEPPPKKMPDLPVLHGVMDLGDGSIAMMSVKEGGAQGTYKTGDMIGDFEIVKIATDRITFRWDGKEVTKLSGELRPTGAAPAKAASTASSAPAPAAPKPPPAPTKPAPGKDLGGSVRACLPGDTSPPGTVVDGYVKRLARTPMGQVCSWAPVEK